jgi:hypothetical protein
MDSLAPIGAQTELEDLTRKEQHDTINPRLNIIFQSESTERTEVELELRGTRDTGDVGSMGKSPRLGHTKSQNERARERAIIMA